MSHTLFILCSMSTFIFIYYCGRDDWFGILHDMERGIDCEHSRVELRRAEHSFTKSLPPPSRPLSRSRQPLTLHVWPRQARDLRVFTCLAVFASRALNRKGPDLD
jgi:hypothetical protein